MIAVVDLMHMGLRIIEKLIDKLIAYIADLDGNDSVKMENRKLFQRFVDFIENDCKVNSPFYLRNEEKGGKIELRSLNYTSMLKIIKCFTIKIFLKFILNMNQMKKCKSLIKS